MKRLFFALACALLLATLWPVTANAAPRWWPHRSHHSNSGDPAKAPKSKNKTKKTKAHHEKHQRQDPGEHLYSSPRSVGWHHKQPGPAGAGS
jgi:hypothetical protein